MPVLATPARLRQTLATTIRRVDPDARDAVLIGSSVYAPELARDDDLVVTTTSPGGACRWWRSTSSFTRR